MLSCDASVVVCSSTSKLFLNGLSAPGAAMELTKPEPLDVDLKQAQEFLNTLDSGGTFTFQTFPDPDKRSPNEKADASNAANLRPPTLWLHGTLEEHAKTLIAANNQGAGVFVMINEGDGKGRKSENVKRVRALFLDLDGAELDPVIGKDKPKPLMIVESSPKRYHVYWGVSDVRLDKFKDMQRSLATKFDGDPSVCDLSRVLRMPGFYNHKYGVPVRSELRRGRSRT
jgi:hypothetical protein